MSEAFDEIKAALEQAIAYTRGEKTPVVVRQVPRVDVASVRHGLGLSQQQFASVFGVSVATVRNWEQHHREPEGPARVLLTVIQREPDAVIRALHLSRATG